VIDYKFSQPHPAGVDPYQFQLRCYALAARHFVRDGVAVRTGIAFLRGDRPEPVVPPASPNDGLDEGAVILTRAVPIEPEDTLGSLYFGKIFPMGVAGLVEVADMVVAGKAPALAQYEPAAGYEGIIRDAESQIHWATHVDQTFNLIRGCNPAPGAWTTNEGKKLFLFESTKRIARTFGEVKGKKIGQVVAQTGSSLTIHGQGGFIEVHRVRWDGGKKIAAAEAGLEVGTILGS